MKVMLDGAWRKESWDGTIARVNTGKEWEMGVCEVVASSAFLMEALAVLKALDWAKRGC